MTEQISSTKFVVNVNIANTLANNNVQQHQNTKGTKNVNIQLSLNLEISDQSVVNTIEEK